LSLSLQKVRKEIQDFDETSGAIAMSQRFQAALEILLEQPPQDWIAVVMIALFLALGLSGVHTAVGRWMKGKTDSAVLAGLAFVFIAFSMVFTAVTIHLRVQAERAPAMDLNSAPRDMARGPGQGFGQGFGPGRGPGGYSRFVDFLFETADADHDGKLSQDEATLAAGKFVQEAGANGDGTVDHEAALAFLRSHVRSPGMPPVSPPPAPTPPPSAPSSTTAPPLPTATPSS